MSKEIKPVLCVLTSNNVKGKSGQPTGYWLSELTEALKFLEKSGLQYALASVKGGEPPADPMSLSDEELKKPANVHFSTDEMFQHALKNTICIDDVDSSKYAAVFFPGGHGTMWDFSDSNGVQRVIREIYEAGGVVSAVCHGPSSLVNATLSDGSYLVAGKNVAAFTNSEEAAVQATNIVPFLLETALKNHGALHHAAPDWAKNVIVDGRLVTGQNPASAEGVGEEVAKIILNK